MFANYFPSTRATALARGSCSGFRPTGVLERATALPMGLHLNGLNFLTVLNCLKSFERRN